MALPSTGLTRDSTSAWCRSLSVKRKMDILLKYLIASADCNVKWILKLKKKGRVVLYGN